jgi:glucosamine-6-phosphate deaminase
MLLTCLPDEDMAAAATARIIATQLQARPSLVLGLATGRTMEAVYRHLVCLHREQGLDFSQCRTFNLDEYLGLGPEHPGSYRHYMHQHLFRHVNLGAGNCQLPDGTAADPVGECHAYEGRIRDAGGIDLQLLGLGLTGHIGFNEPPADFNSRTHVTVLDPVTRAQNADGFEGGLPEVPTRAITMGIGTILEARECLLLATGAGKAAILRKVLDGAVTTQVPGSILRRHPRCRVLADQEAAGWPRLARCPGEERG